VSTGPEPFAERLRRVGGAFQETKIVTTAVTLGLFELLASRPHDAAEAQRAVGAEARRGVEVLLDALVALGYLTKAEGVYDLTEGSRRYLVAGGPESVAHITAHRDLVFRSWARLDELVLHGRQLRDEAKPTLADPVANRSFILGMAEVSRERLDLILQALPLDQVDRLVDLGGGPGHYACAAVTGHGVPQATLVDLPLTVDVAREYIAGQGLSDRVNTVVCDFYRAPTIDLGGLADGVLLSQVLHCEGPAENLALLQRIAGSLRPGGWVAVCENLVDPERTSPVAGAVFAVSMLAGTERGRTYTAAEISAWLARAGLAVRPVVHVAPRTGLVLGFKPQR